MESFGPIIYPSPPCPLNYVSQSHNRTTLNQVFIHSRTGSRTTLNKCTWVITTSLMLPRSGLKYPGCTLRVPRHLPSTGREQNKEPAKPLLCSPHPKSLSSTSLVQNGKKRTRHALLLLWGTRRHGYSISEAIARWCGFGNLSKGTAG